MSQLEEEKKKQFFVIEYKVVNIVATATLDMPEERIDLNKIARKYVDAEYNPERFPGLILRFKKPKATVLIFSTGKLVITGLKVETDAKTIVKRVMNHVKKSNFAVKCEDENIVIQNFVVSSDLKKHVDLNMAAIVLENVMYEPEVFPGLIYRVKDQTPEKSVFLVFSTGKIICSGSRSREIIDNNMKQVFQDFKEGNLLHENEEKEFEEFF